MLAAYVLGHELPAVSFWSQAAHDEPVAHSSETLPQLWEAMPENARCDFLLDIGALTPLQDPRRPDKERVLAAIQQAPGKCIDVSHLATLAGMDPKRVSQLVFQLKRQKHVKEIRRGVYTMGKGASS